MNEPDNSRIVLGLLTSVEQDGAQSQRKLAASLGIAVGLVNAYLKRCVTKGLVKMSQVPRRRYAYYLTPKGFSEKSRLTVEYLSSSFSFFREAKADCARVFEAAKSRGLRDVVLVGKSDLAEIAILCAVQSGINVVAIIDSGAAETMFAGVRVVKSFSAVPQPFDAVVVTDFEHAKEAYETALIECKAKPVSAPALLGLPAASSIEAAP